MSTHRDHVPFASPLAYSPEPPRAIASVQTGEDRISLRRPAGTGEFVDGGWWPRSLDLIAELPALLTAAGAAGYGQVHRVSFALNAWDGPPPRKSTMLNHVVKLGGFRAQEPAEMSLVDSSGWKRVTVVVVPPGTDPVVARHALAMAGTAGDRHRAREILDLAHRASSAHAGQSGCVDERAAAGSGSEGAQVTP
jgi:hypothetical protein